MNLITDIARTLYAMPFRAWSYGQRFPYEAILYGLVLIAAAMISKLLIVIIATATIVSGMNTILRGQDGL